MSSTDFYKNALAGLETLRESVPELAGFYQAVLEAQEEAHSKFKPDLGALDMESLRDGTADGAPFLTAQDVRVDPGLFASLFDRINALWDKAAEDTDVRGGSKPSLFANEDGWQQSLVKGLMEDHALVEKLAQQVGMDVGALMFVGAQTLVPFLEKYAAGLHEHIDDSTRTRGSCPVCGGEPLMARLADETGQRFLGCCLCRTEWAYKRLECPFCGTSEQAKLRYFYDEQEPCYRVEVCDNCKTYLKTVDARKADRQICLFIENLASLHLDLVAKKEGFQRDTNRLFGL